MKHDQRITKVTLSSTASDSHTVSVHLEDGTVYSNTYNQRRLAVEILNDYHFLLQKQEA
jgi:hypothetical protein